MDLHTSIHDTPTYYQIGKYALASILAWIFASSLTACGVQVGVGTPDYWATKLRTEHEIYRELNRPGRIEISQSHNKQAKSLDAWGYGK